MSLIGYARVSTAEGRQVLDRQLDALNEAGCERVFEDRASGAASDRPKLAACLDHLRQSDVLVVLDLDRLGRRAGELIALIDELDRRGVGFRALNSPMDTTTPAGHPAAGGNPGRRPGRPQPDPAQAGRLPTPQRAHALHDRLGAGPGHAAPRSVSTRENPTTP